MAFELGLYPCSIHASDRFIAEFFLIFSHGFLSTFACLYSRGFTSPKKQKEKKIHTPRYQRHTRRRKRVPIAWLTTQCPNGIITCYSQLREKLLSVKREKKKIWRGFFYLFLIVFFFPRDSSSSSSIGSSSSLFRAPSWSFCCCLKWIGGTGGNKCSWFSCWLVGFTMFIVQWETLIFCYFHDYYYCDYFFYWLELVIRISMSPLYCVSRFVMDLFRCRNNWKPIELACAPPSVSLSFSLLRLETWSWLYIQCRNELKFLPQPNAVAAQAIFLAREWRGGRKTGVSS